MNHKIKSKIWIETNGEVFIGEGRVKLLKAIAQTGSLSKAAKSLNMSYKKAWTLIDVMNNRSKEPIVTTSIGGRGGGGATLTEYGTKLINIFDSINKNCWEFLEEQLQSHLGEK